MTLERRHLGKRAYALVSPLLESDGFLVAFTERTGGVSSEPRFASLNLSFSSGDEPSAVTANRERVTSALGTGPFAVGGQVHGSHLAAVGPKLAGSGYDGPDGVISATDGLHTRSRGVALAVATADCVPVVLGSAREGRIAVVHAGWRGVASGIVSAALSRFTQPGEVRAAIGPAAGGCCYEVGEEVALAVSAAVPKGAVVERSGAGSLRLDLPASIARVLRDGGVRRIEQAGLCTIHEHRRFFSHRRDGPCGRQFAIGMRL